MNPNVPAVAVPQALIGPMTVEEARKGGFKCLSPLDKAVAIEFATTGHTLRQVAMDIGQPLGDVRKAFSSPLVRGFIHDLQMEVAQHKIINAAWVEQQVMAVWPQLTGEEDVALVTAKGEAYNARKFHSAEVTSILRHFSGNSDQKKAGGVQVMINFGDMGVAPSAPPQVTVVEAG